MTNRTPAGKNQYNGANAPSKGREKQIVLLVDSDVVSQFYTSVFLQRLEYHVCAAKTAEEALMIMELTVPLLVITEINLPRMSGVEFLKHVKHDPRTRDVPVLIYTSMMAASYRDACMAAGCNGYLTQPAEHNQLYEAVQKATETAPRHFVRLATRLDVSVTPPGGNEQNSLVTAISEHGMFVDTPHPLPNGTTAWFTVQLPNASTSGIKIQGKVLYSHAGGSGKSSGMGVKFQQIGPDHGALIKAFIKDKLTEGLAKASETRTTGGA